MFESLKAWFDSIDDESKLFRHADDEVLHSALAAVIHHFIALEKRHSGREKHEFERIMKHEFALTQDQIDHLYAASASTGGQLDDDLRTINEHLKDDPAARMSFMQMLLRLVNMHGAHSEELQFFYETLHSVFPELRELGGSEDV